MRHLFIAASTLTVAPAIAAGPVVFVHDQIDDTILRLQDRNFDGDTNDPGEATVFFDDTLPITGVDNAQGLVALGPYEVLATDNFKPDNIVLLRDLNRDGDALDPGENSVFFSGLLPSGQTITNPADLVPRADGSFFLLDNNTADTTRPEAIYILRDLNGDDDVDDPGEVTLFHQLSPAGVIAATTFDVTQDDAGNVYVLDITDPDQIESIDIIDPAGAARSEWLGSDTLFAIDGVVLVSTVAELDHIPATDEILFGASTLGNDSLLLAGKDLNASGTINAGSETRVLWAEATHADAFSTGSPRDFVLAADTDIYWTDGLRDRVMRLSDNNADADYQDAGETTVFFDADTAELEGLPIVELPLSLDVVIPCPADFADPRGGLDFNDVLGFLTDFADQHPDADLAPPGFVYDFNDVLAFLEAFAEGCP